MPAFKSVVAPLMAFMRIFRGRFSITFAIGVLLRLATQYHTSSIDCQYNTKTYLPHAHLMDAGHYINISVELHQCHDICRARLYFTSALIYNIHAYIGIFMPAVHMSMISARHDVQHGPAFWPQGSKSDKLQQRRKIFQQCAHMS